MISHIPYTDIVSDSELDNFRNNHFGFFRLEKSNISKLLIWQLYYLEMNRLYSAFDVLDEIKYLEGNSKSTKTKKEDKLKGRYLRGLWHKHFFSARFISRNIINYWEMNKKDNSRFDKLLKDVFNKSDSEYITDEMINDITYRLTDEPLHNKILPGKWTGEWIVFAKYNAVNYYLSLGKHGDDENIHSLIMQHCIKEFPILKQAMIA